MSMKLSAMIERGRAYVRAFAPFRLARFQDYDRHKRTVVAPATVSHSSANALLADGNVTLGGGAEVTQANVDALKQKILSHEFGIA